jgi:hypothetical protein
MTFFNTKKWWEGGGQHISRKNLLEQEIAGRGGAGVLAVLHVREGGPHEGVGA